MKKLLFILLLFVSTGLIAQYQPYTQSFRKLADLNVQVGRPYSSYWVNGGTVDGDGGGGMFYWDPASTATPVAGSIVQVTGVTTGRWLKENITSGEVPLTFSTGLTRAVNTITSNLSTGIAGGQTAIGGTAGANTLKLRPNVFQNKSKIFFGDSSVYDDSLHRLGINTTSPVGKISAVQSNSGFLFSGVNTNPLSQAFLSIENDSAYYIRLVVGGSQCCVAGQPVSKASLRNRGAIYTNRNMLFVSDAGDDKDGGSDISFRVGGSQGDQERVRIKPWGISIMRQNPDASLDSGNLNPTAKLHIGANSGTVLAGSAPLKFDEYTGTLPSAENGAFWFRSGHLYFDIGSTHYKLDQQTAGSAGNPDTLHSNLWSYYLARANHTGTQTLSTISDFPSQAGNSGKYLTTNGTTPSWGTVSAGGTWGSITGTLSAQTDLQAAIDAKANNLLTVNTQTANYTLVLADGTTSIVRMNLGSAGTLTVPPNSSVAFPIGTQITISQTGTGQITITPGSGVTLNSADGFLKTRVQHSPATLIKTLTDTWLVSGDLTN